MICLKEKKYAYLQIKPTNNKSKFTQSTHNLIQRFQIMKKTCLECSLKTIVSLWIQLLCILKMMISNHNF